MHSGLQRDQYVRVLQSRARAKCERPLGFASCSVRDSQVSFVSDQVIVVYQLLCLIIDLDLILLEQWSVLFN